MHSHKKIVVMASIGFAVQSAILADCEGIMV
jgi:hypothetical protein